jgi:crotonobetainyl-CoA:carnitine CoA-transferase CaiB-like acyl-CoA transferase
MLPLLTGLRIVDATTIILGPYATQILGDLGADVIKVEPLEGDLMRAIPPAAEPGMSAIYVNHNRNKRSIALDLKHDDGKAVLSRLIASADALIHNVRQDAMDRLGFGFVQARALNPRIVYCAAVGFGSAGPYAGRPAYDDTIQAASGLAGLFQMRDGTPAYAPTIIADKVVGLHVVHAVLAALLHRERTGGGAVEIEVPMFEAMASFFLTEHLAAATFEDDGALGYHRGLAPHRRPYRTKDGWVAVLPYTTAHWVRALGEIGRPDLAAEPWIADNAERSRRTPELYAVLAEAIGQRTTQGWLDTFERLDIPHAPVNTPADLLKDPHMQAIGFFEPRHASPSAIRRALGQPVTIRDMAATPDQPAAALGADAAAVLAHLGFTDEEARRLLASPGLGGAS